MDYNNNKNEAPASLASTLASGCCTMVLGLVVLGFFFVLILMMQGPKQSWSQNFDRLMNRASSEWTDITSSKEK